MPQRWDFGTPGVPRVSKFCFLEHDLIDEDNEQNIIHVKKITIRSNW